MSVTFAVQQDARGTADAVLSAEAFAGNAPFLVLNSDNYYPVDVLRALVALDGPGLPAFRRSTLIAQGNIDPGPHPQLRHADDRRGRHAAGHRRKAGRRRRSRATLPDHGDDVRVSMNCWRFGPSIFTACRRIEPSPRGELELPNAVRYAVRVMGERFRAIPVDAGVLDLSRREDIARSRATALERRAAALNGCARVVIAPNLARALEGAGLSGEAASAHAVRFDHVLATLAAERRDQDAWDAWYVPGRIEVLGKHTDYGGGRSLICAAERGFHVVSAPRTDRRLAMTDIGRGVALVLDADGPRAGRQLGDVSPDRVAPPLPELPGDEPRRRPGVRERPAVGGGNEQLERADDCGPARPGAREPPGQEPRRGSRAFATATTTSRRTRPPSKTVDSFRALGR